MKENVKLPSKYEMLRKGSAGITSSIEDKETTTTHEADYLRVHIYLVTNHRVQQRHVRAANRWVADFGEERHLGDEHEGTRHVVQSRRAQEEGPERGPRFPVRRHVSGRVHVFGVAKHPGQDKPGHEPQRRPNEKHAQWLGPVGEFADNERDHYADAVEREEETRKVNGWLKSEHYIANAEIELKLVRME